MTEHEWATRQTQLRRRGWIRNPDGSLSSPSRAPRSDSGIVGAVGAGVAEPSARREAQNPNPQRSERSVEHGFTWRIAFLSCRRRLLDEGDNDRAALKPLRDAVARSLGFSNDNDPVLEWCYDQCEVRAPNGVLVSVERVFKTAPKTSPQT